MKRLVCILSVPLAVAFLVPALPAQQTKSSDRAAAHGKSSTPIRELDWDTYLDKVQGGWMGKMIGVTFGQPWEFNYQGAPIGFDITDWTLSPTRMKDYRARAENNGGYQDPVTREADSQKVHINKGFIEASEKEHPSFGAPDNDDIYINILFLYCLRHYGIDVSPVTVAHEWDAKIRQVWHAFERRYGYSREEVLGRTVHDLNIWEDPADRVRMVALLQKSGPIRNVITHLRTKSGEIKLTAYSADRIQFDGQPCILAVSEDLPEYDRERLH